MVVNASFPSFSSVTKVVVPIPAVAENAVLTFAELQVLHAVFFSEFVELKSANGY